jgi:hypothetical protein
MLRGTILFTVAKEWASPKTCQPCLAQSLAPCAFQGQQVYPPVPILAFLSKLISLQANLFNHCSRDQRTLIIPRSHSSLSAIDDLSDIPAAGERPASSPGTLSLFLIDRIQLGLCSDPLVCSPIRWAGSTVRRSFS